MPVSGNVQKFIMRELRTKGKRFGGDRAGFELTIGADADLAAKRPGW
jgi:hypothetical protein